MQNCKNKKEPQYRTNPNLSRIISDLSDKVLGAGNSKKNELNDRIFSVLENFEDRLRNSKLMSIVLIGLLLVGMSPLLVKFSQRIVEYSKENKFGLPSLPSNNPYERIEGFVEKGEFYKAEQTIAKLKEDSNNWNDLYAYEGLLELNKGNYENSLKLFKIATARGFQPSWLRDYMGTAYIANNQTLEAANLLNWQEECQNNNFSLSGCLNTLAQWHSRIGTIEKRLNRCTVDLNKGSFHAKREIIFQGESLKALLKAIEETDGPYKDHLIKLYNSNKKKLVKLQKTFLVQHYLEENKVEGQSLTKEELNFKTI
jgi:tetratricopeptide (TPR) repeat protein